MELTPNDISVKEAWIPPYEVIRQNSWSLRRYQSEQKGWTNDQLLLRIDNRFWIDRLICNNHPGKDWIIDPEIESTEQCTTYFCADYHIFVDYREPVMNAGVIPFLFLGEWETRAEIDKLLGFELPSTYWDSFPPGTNILNSVYLCGLTWVVLCWKMDNHNGVGLISFDSIGEEKYKNSFKLVNEWAYENMLIS